MNKAICIVIGLALLAGLQTAQAQNNWKDYVDDTPAAKQPLEDNPAWDKYEFELPLANSEDKLTFKDIARRGEPFVLYWWLTNCPMCHLQMPFVQQLYNQSADDELGLGIYGICIDSRGEDYLKYIEEKKIGFPVLLDQHSRRTREAFKVSDLGTPLAYVFNDQGLLVGSIEGYRNNFGASVLGMLGIEAPTE